MPQGTYFITADIAPLGESDGLAFCRGLPHRCGVVAVPNVVFYDDQQAGRTQVRFAFCKRDEVLADAADRLRRLRATDRLASAARYRRHYGRHASAGRQVSPAASLPG